MEKRSDIIGRKFNMSNEKFMGLKLEKSNDVKARYDENSELKEIHTIVDAVRCSECDKLHHKDGEDYLSLVGNVHIGSDGGIWGNGNWEKNGINVMYFCLKDRCMSNAVSKMEHSIIEEEEYYG